MQISVLGIELDLDESYVEESPRKITQQVTEYQTGTRQEFDLTVSRPNGFLGDVMKAMEAIPYGETRTYGDIAARLDTAPVAVGQACGRNPIPIIVPCHRVVAADGLGGYSAGGDRNLELKRGLLELEA